MNWTELNWTRSGHTLQTCDSRRSVQFISVHSGLWTLLKGHLKVDNVLWSLTADCEITKINNNRHVHTDEQSFAYSTRRFTGNGSRRFTTWRGFSGLEKCHYSRLYSATKETGQCATWPPRCGVEVRKRRVWRRRWGVCAVKVRSQAYAGWGGTTPSPRRCPTACTTAFNTNTFHYWGNSGLPSFPCMHHTAVPTVWDSFPATTRSFRTSNTFREHLETHVFQSAFNSP